MQTGRLLPIFVSTVSNARSAHQLNIERDYFKSTSSIRRVGGAALSIADPADDVFGSGDSYDSDFSGARGGKTSSPESASKSAETWSGASTSRASGSTGISVGVG